MTDDGRLTTTDRILQAAEGVRGETEALLAELVRQPSLLGQEQGALEVMAQAFRSLGLEPRRVPTDPAVLANAAGWSPPLTPYGGRENGVALHRPREARGRSLLLQGHVDVVPEGAADLW